VHLKIHLIQSFLHMHLVLCSHLDQLSRCRHSERIAQIVPGGRKLVRNKPSECRYWIHWQSETSVFLPGTFLTYCAFTK
jgi:hypothetical protein